MENNINSAIGITDILIDTISKKYDNIRDLNSLNVNLEEENYEAMVPVIDSIIEDENNSIGKLQQLIDLLSGSEEDIEEGKQDTIEIIDNGEFVESVTKMKKKLRLSENFDNVIDDVQAVADPVFVGANIEHDENKKKYEDAIEENKKEAEEIIPKEGDTGKEVKSKALKSMHLSEKLFEDTNYSIKEEVEEFLTELTGELEDNLAMKVASKVDSYEPEWCEAVVGDYPRIEERLRKAQDNYVNALLDMLFAEKESLNEDLSFDNYSDFNSAVYNAISEVCFEFQEKGLSQKDIEAALEWFETHFFDSGDFEEENIIEESWDNHEYHDDKWDIVVVSKYANGSMDRDILLNGEKVGEIWDDGTIDLKKSISDEDKEELIRFTDGDLLHESCDKELKEATDLSKIEGTITKALQDNANIINKCKTADELFKVVAETLESAHIDTNYSKKFLDKLSKMKSFVGALQYVYNIILSGSGNKTIKLGESYVAEWWGQVDGDIPREVAKRYNLSVKPLKKRRDEILYKFEGNLDDFSRALDDGYFYSLIVQQDAGHSEDVNSLLYESIQSKIAKEQIKRFTEGKMPKNWDVNSYLEKLVESKHINKREAKSLN